MGYQVLARKWRPGKFSELVGQEHVVKAISSALDNNRLHHAYLFTGTRGVGKTTIARIFSRSLNCETGISSNPCGKCASCVDIEKGNYVDLLEIDAASRTKVEDTREILDNVQYRPTRGEYKVYLIDEVHMLSKHSFNALLKTLEEPPPHVKFLLATTDPQKLPVTILSRCLQFNLKALTREQISGQLQHILSQEQIPFENSALFQLAKSAQGSMRDALSLTDQAIAQGDGKVMPDIVADMLGLIDSDKIIRVIDALLAQDKVAMLNISDELSLLGADYKAALGDMMSLFHQVALTQFVPEACKLETNQARKIFDWAKTLPPEHVQLLYQIALQGKKELEWAQDARSGFEMTLIRMLAFSPKLEIKPATEYKNMAAQQATIGSISLTPASTTEKKSIESESESEPEIQLEPPMSLRSDRDSNEQQNAVTTEHSGSVKENMIDSSEAEDSAGESVQESQLNQEINTIYTQAEELTGRLDFQPPDESHPEMEPQHYFEPVSADEEHQYFSPESQYGEHDAPAEIQAEPVPAAMPETDGQEHSSNTDTLLALHSQLKAPPATQETDAAAEHKAPDHSVTEGNSTAATSELDDHRPEEIAGSAKEDKVSGANNNTATPVSDYQDDLYNTGETRPADAKQEPAIELNDAEVDEDPDGGPYFSAEGFLHEHQHEHQHEHPPQDRQEKPASQPDAAQPQNQEEQVQPGEYDVPPVSNEELISEPQSEDSEAVQEYLDAMPEAGYLPQSEDTLSDDVNAAEDLSAHDSVQEPDRSVPEEFDAYALPEWITFEQANAVSVDFEIPFKINGKKVLHSSQLDTWSQLIEQSGIGALTKQLVLHSNYVKKGDVVELVVAEQQKHLLNEATMKTIEEALSETLQQNIKLQITVGEVIDTPWAVQRAINTMRQEHAEQTIQDDPVVAQLCEHFSGTVIKETIKPR